jgi:DNA polymerase-3 subunit epsilon
MTAASDARRLGGLVAGALGAGVLGAVAGLWLLVPELAREGLGDAAGVLLGAGGLLAAGGGLAVARWVGAHLGGARRLAEEVDLIASVNPSHRVTAGGEPEVEAIAAAVNRLAGRFWESLSERDAAIARGREDAEADRERLAALMAELSHGVLVCNADGRILLYNHEARRLFAEPAPGGGPSSPVGLGRSVFSLLDRGALTNAFHRLELDPSPSRPVRLTAAGPGGQLLRASVGAVGGGAGSPGSPGSSALSGLSGFVIVVDDATAELEARDVRAELIREILEESRGRLAAIGGAMAMLEGFEDLDPADIARFQGIVTEESERLAAYLAGVQRRDEQVTGTGWERSDILCRDLLWAAHRQITEAGRVEVSIGDDGGLWTRVDAGGVLAVIADLAGLLGAAGEVKEIELGCRAHEPFVALSLSWSGQAGAVDSVRARAAGGDVALLARRHGGEAWLSEGDRSELTILLPEAVAVPRISLPVPADDRPTTYDFALLARRPVDEDLARRPLAELSYTVFDLETTGLEPARGDRIVSVGAVRIVNGRLLHHETFDCLVDPGLPIPHQATAVHGITDEMVSGEPPIADVLPYFARFAEETVLVGHNVAFDMRFLEREGPPAGTRLDGPVLDTLLLAELAFGEAETHSLEWLGAVLGVDVTGRHTALGDALVTAEVFCRLIPLLDTKRLHTLGEVTAAAATTRYARLDY